MLEVLDDPLGQAKHELIGQVHLFLLLSLPKCVHHEHPSAMPSPSGSLVELRGSAGAMREVECLNGQVDLLEHLPHVDIVRCGVWAIMGVPYTAGTCSTGSIFNIISKK